MTDLFSLVYGMIFEPAATLRRIARLGEAWQSVQRGSPGQREEPAEPGNAPGASGGSLLGKAFAVAALAAVVEGSAMGSGWVKLAGEAMGALPPAAGAALACLSAGWRLATWFVATGVVHVAAESLGGDGRALSLLTLLGFCRAPGLLLAPLSLVPGLTGSGERTLAGLVVAGWITALAVLAVREAYSIGTGRAIAAVLLPVAGLVLLALASLVVLGAAASLGVPGPGLSG